MRSVQKKRAGFFLSGVLIVLAFLALLPGTRAEAASAGWRQEDGVWYYDTGSGPAAGWLKAGGKWYYLDPETGAMAAGWLSLEDGTYYLESSGAMKTGWLWLDGNWYYFSSAGRQQTGWVYAGSKWYYLDPATGVMATGWITIPDDGTYYLESSGAMKTGWLWLDGAWYYFNSSGRQQKGWAYAGSKWYYLDPETGVMAAPGWLAIPDDGTYYLLSSGAMYTGWLKQDGDWYCFGGSGRMLTGWNDVDNDTYYFYTQDDPNGGSPGVMAYSTTIDDTVIKSSGAAVTQKEIYMKSVAQTLSSATNYLLVVDSTGCKTGVFCRSGGAWELLYYWNCAPGKPSTPTVTGRFTVRAKGYYFDSGSSRCYWYTQFYGNYLFHTVLHYKDGSLQDGRVGMRLSHGCVRLKDSNAKWIYDNIPAGTTVYVY